MTLNKQQFIEESIAEVGFSDFGDFPLEEPLDILIRALDSEAELNDFGKIRAELLIRSGLTDRLRMQKYIAENPDVLEQDITQPVFILGLPRTGTTALSHMLNKDPANHTLRIWEAQNPVPPPEEATYETDPRIADMVERLELSESFLPGLSKTHLLEANAPDECYMLFNRNFMSVEYSAMFHIPTYTQWLMHHDLDELYAYHKVQLQLLQHKKKGRWMLKCPGHQLGLTSILNTYPDAIIVQTHRDPMTLVASGCSFSEILRRGCSDQVKLDTVGRDWLQLLHDYMSRFEKARAELEPGRPQQFIDIYHDDFVKDPWPAIEAIYSALGSTVTEAGRQQMQGWIDNNPKGKQGKHEYQLSTYGIDASEVDELFKDYKNRYAV